MVLNEGLKQIDAWCFSDCKKLSRIVIPESVKYIQDYAFENCTKLMNVYYGGSENDWKAATILYTFDTGLNPGTVIHYNYEK